MILPVHVPSFQSYFENPRLVLENAYVCPCCMTRSLSRHGGVWRWVYFVDFRERVRIFRLRCRPCGITATLLPDFLVPHRRYAAPVVEAGKGMYLDGAGSCREVAMAITGKTVPEALAPASRTDAIEMLDLKPGYQRIHAWVSALATTAVADVQAAVAWVTTRVPTSLVVDAQTAPLDPPSTGRTRDAGKRAGLDASRVLVRIFSCVPELNPAGTGWLAASQRFAAVVLKRGPWIGPPRSPPEPRTS